MPCCCCSTRYNNKSWTISSFIFHRSLQKSQNPTFSFFFFMYHNKKTITLWFKWSDYFFSHHRCISLWYFPVMLVYIYVSFFIYIIPIPYILAVCISHIPFVFRSVLKVASVGEYVVHGGFFFFVYRTYICILYNCNFLCAFPHECLLLLISMVSVVLVAVVVLIVTSCTTYY